METAGKSTSKENNTLVLDNHLILLALNSHFQLNVACYPTATIIILYYNNITLTCQTQSKKRRKTGPCPLYLFVDKPTLTHRSANGWPPRSHSLSISPSNLYKITGNGQKSALTHENAVKLAQYRHASVKMPLARTVQLNPFFYWDDILFCLNMR